MTNLQQDFRYALRHLRRSPLFALTTVFTLAVSMGATIAIFSFVNAVLLRPLPFQDSARLVTVWERVPYLGDLYPRVAPNPRHVFFWRQQQTAFAAMSLVGQGTTGVSLDGRQPLYVGRVSAEPNLLDLLGVAPALGRNFLPEEGAPGHGDRVIITWHLWQTLFAADPNVLQRTLFIGGRPTQIIGVLPSSFYFPRANEWSADPKAQQSPGMDVLLPLSLKPEDFGWNSDYGNFEVIGRLKPGLSLAVAQQQLDAASLRIVQQAPAGEFATGKPGQLSTMVQPFKEAIVGRTTGVLWMLFGAVMSVLLVACINLANARLAQTLARDREAAVRTALGASKWQILQTELVESTLLAVIGAGLGVLGATFVVAHFGSLVHVALPRVEGISLGGPVLLFIVGTTATVTLLFGLLPALRHVTMQPQAALSGSASTAGTPRGGSLRRWMTGAQVFACTALLLLTVLFSRSLADLLHRDMGFDPNQLVVAHVWLQGQTYTDARRAGFTDAVLERLQRLPGVQNAASVSAILSQGQDWVDSLGQGAHQGGTNLTEFRWISPDYFETLGQKLIQGRFFNAGDRGRKVVVLTASAAHALCGERNCLGLSVQRGNGQQYTVVGIVAETRNHSLRAAPVSMAYFPYWDNPPYEQFFLLRAPADSQLMTTAVRQAIWQYDPSVTIASVNALRTTVSDDVAPERMQTALLASFGFAAVLLALLGIYGTLNASVQRRTREFGVRMALGASRSHVYRLTLGELASPFAAGLLGGAVLSILIGRAVRSMLLGAPQNTASVFVWVGSLLAIAALIAATGPCFRASRTEPIVALRTE